jgi:hypothetical protein
MDAERPEPSDILPILEGIQDELTRLRERVEALEGSRPAASAASIGPRAQPTAALDPDVVRTMAAAVAAYLGVEAPIRSIRLLESQAWAQEGRSTIQAWYSVSPSPSSRG